jgi:cytidylate kinase
MAIAIDGPVASGKTVVGRSVARELGYRFLDTGMMYRAATLIALRRNVDLTSDDEIANTVSGLSMELITSDSEDRLLVDGEDVTNRLRGREVETNVSRVSSVTGVRQALVEQQRQIAACGGIVMVGRDIGTVVLNDAPLKFYLDASVETRAHRRFTEIEARGGAADYDLVRDDLVRRDRIDSERAASPLRIADDAIVIDTDDMAIEDVVVRIVGEASIR